jgi:hypothetical protein
MDWEPLVLRDGDCVEAWGRLVRTRKGDFFDPPGMPRPAILTARVWAPTGFGLRAIGADFDAVEGRKEYEGDVEGTATLTGHWIGGDLHVEAQTPQRLGERRRECPAWDTPPCPPPAGGWPHSKRDARLRFDLKHLEVDGAAVQVTVFHPSRTQRVLVVAAADPAAVEAVLRPQLGTRLCVVPARYTRAQVTAARATLGGRMSDYMIWEVYGTADEQGQPVLNAGLTRITPALAHWLTTRPDGLVYIDAWLTPRPEQPRSH